MFCQDRLDYHEALRFNRRCLETGTPWLWATTGPMGRAYVSPLFLPDAGPCLACLLNHFRRLSPAPDFYDDLSAHAAAGRPIAPVPFPGPAVEIVRQLIVWKAGLTGEPEAPAALYRLHVLEVGSLEVTSHRVLRRSGVSGMWRPKLSREWYASPYTGLFAESGPVPLQAYDPAVPIWSGTAPLPDPAAEPPAAGGAGWDEAAAEAAGVGEAIDAGRLGHSRATGPSSRASTPGRSTNWPWAPGLPGAVPPGAIRPTGLPV